MAKKSASKKSVGKKVSTPKVGIMPLGDRVLIRPLSLEEMGTKTASGIIIPDTVDKEKSEQGEVIAIGEGRYEDGTLVKPAVAIGDRVIFSWGREVKHGDEVFMLVKSEDILAIIS